jgi:hypothetical protein
MALRSARILCESRLRWWNGANRLRETDSKRLVDAESCWDDDEAGSVWRPSGAAAARDLPVLFPEEEAAMSGRAVVVRE